MEDYKKKYENLLHDIDIAIAGQKEGETKIVLQNLKERNTESEDERIRKMIIHVINITPATIAVQYRKEMLDWLEKQVEKKVDKCEGCNNIKGCITCTDGDQYAHITEQKPADKVEPKFKVGDWVVMGICDPLKIIDVIAPYYKVISTKGNLVSISIDYVDSYYHIWTIQDAKKGDVLQANKCALIFDSLTKDIDGNIVISSWYYCDTETFYGMGTCKPDLWVTEGVVPATKEQRDFLFSKMKEAGYEWDVEKKELKKIEQKPAWSEEDDRNLSIAIQYVFQHGYLSTVNWLKSLKERYIWKPSNEQMKQLGWVAEQNKDNMIGKELMSLYQDLKKLRKE